MTRAAAVFLLSVTMAFSAPVLSAQDSVSRGLLDMMNRIEQMQRDVQQLRGDVEVQTHTVQELQRRSREQYLDIDRRLQQIETGQSGRAAAPAPPVLSVPTPAPVARVPVVPVPQVSRQPQIIAPRAPAPAPVAAPASADEKTAYDTALAVLREGRYADAVNNFSQFLINYPGSSYADNATYWLGETYYVTRDFDRALQTFKGMPEKYPNSPKVSDSQLKTGYIFYEKKDWPAARQALEIVVSGHPGSTAARLASDRLARMKKEGH